MIIDSGKKVNAGMGKDPYFTENVRFFTSFWEGLERICNPVGFWYNGEKGGEGYGEGLVEEVFVDGWAEA